ncbi:MAG: sulfite exporter TauE/SafE family protein [Spirochaetaceae bacterium]|nr:sulfite exporter TauE/SafE family protein [Spirochaetaceae bacterium]
MDAKTEKTKVLRISGMTCVNCQNRIEKKLKSTPGVEDAQVNYNTGTAAVTYNTAVISLNEITQTIEALDYKVLDDTRRESGIPAAGILIIILALYMLLRQFGIAALTSAFPLAEAGMGYGMLFIIGLVTSVHCAGMCGGINLSQCISPGKSGGRFAVLFPSLLYNAGRIASYTTVGVIVGALGSAITVTGVMQGFVQIIAGVFMVIMGINMLGFFPGLRRFNLRMPRIFAKKIEAEKAANKSPLIIGLLNGLMPCGPLQAMQLYALSTGSPVKGGISMFLFSLGTVPLMFGLGALGSLLSHSSRGRSFSAAVMKVGAILVTVLGLTMFSNGWNLGGLPAPLSLIPRIAAPFGEGTVFAGPAANAAAASFVPVIEGGAQVVNSTLGPGRYPAITVQAGIPVKWTINAPQGSINGCNNRMLIREYGIEHRFTPGDNLIEFVPERTGRFPYSCWMGMIRSSITVVAEGESPGDGAGGSGIPAPVPAGVAIPVEDIVIAAFDGERGLQRVKIELGDEGFSPSVIVLEKNVRTEWTIYNDSLDEGNSALIFPLYSTRIPIAAGDNILGVLPSRDFEFSTIDNIYYGYVKVVDDINSIDVNAIKEEAAGFETLIYPDEYFEAANQGGCCG